MSRYIHVGGYFGLTDRYYTGLNKYFYGYVLQYCIKKLYHIYLHELTKLILRAC